MPVMRYLPSSVAPRGQGVSLGGGNPDRVTLWPGHPNPVQRVGRKEGIGGAPSTGRPGPASPVIQSLCYVYAFVTQLTVASDGTPLKGEGKLIPTTSDS